MPLPADDPVRPDVLVSHDEERPGRWRPPPTPASPWLIIVGMTLAAVVGVVALLPRQEDPRVGVVDASGSLVLEHQFSSPADRPNSTLVEDENARFSGPITVTLPDREMLGFAVATFSFAAGVDAVQILSTHTWGDMRVTFDQTTCHGPFAWTFYREPHETGGSMSLRCDDGSLFAARALMDGDEGGDGQPYRFLVTLQDGSYVGG